MQATRSLALKIAGAALALGALGTASVAQARDNINWSIGINAAPGVVIGANNGYRPYYVQPAPVYVQPQTYYAPPIYSGNVYPANVYPSTYYSPAPVYVQPAPVYYGPRYYNGHRGGHGNYGRGYGHRR